MYRRKDKEEEQVGINHICYDFEPLYRKREQILHMKVSSPIWVLLIIGLVTLFLTHSKRDIEKFAHYDAIYGSIQQDRLLIVNETKEIPTISHKPFDVHFVSQESELLEGDEVLEDSHGNSPTDSTHIPDGDSHGNSLTDSTHIPEGDSHDNSPTHTPDDNPHDNSPTHTEPSTHKQSINSTHHAVLSPPQQKKYDFQDEDESHLHLVFNTSTYPRGPVNLEKRGAYNDILHHIRNRRHMFLGKEGAFKQQYRLEFLEGSKVVGTEGFTGGVRNETDFTIISQTTTERLFFFPMLLKRWQGDFCVTVFLTEEEVEQTRSQLLSQHYPSRLHLILYIVNPKVSKDCVYRRRDGSLFCHEEKVYPLNRLRNIAIQHIQTTHFIVFDMDMWPAKFLYKTLKGLPPSYLASEYVVTIIPAFSLPSTVIKSPKCTDLRSCVKMYSCLSAIKSYPETRQELVKCLRGNKCTIFRPNSHTHDYLPKKWISLPPTTQLTKVKCFRQRFLEPYVMVRKTTDLPLFDERFINYGFNKVQWIENLRYRGYDFHILSQAYAIDIPHSISSYAKKYNEGFVDKTMPMLALYRRFLTDMRAEYKDESRQMLCLRRNTNLKDHRQ